MQKNWSILDVVSTVCFGCVIRKERDTMQFLIYVTSVLLVLGKYTHKNALLRVRKSAKMFFANRFCNQRGYNILLYYVVGCYQTKMMRCSPWSMINIKNNASFSKDVCFWSCFQNYTDDDQYVKLTSYCVAYPKIPMNLIFRQSS